MLESSSLKISKLMRLEADQVQQAHLHVMGFHLLIVQDVHHLWQPADDKDLKDGAAHLFQERVPLTLLVMPRPRSHLHVLHLLLREDVHCPCKHTCNRVWKYILSCSLQLKAHFKE